MRSDASVNKPSQVIFFGGGGFWGIRYLPSVSDLGCLRRCKNILRGDIGEKMNQARKSLLYGNRSAVSPTCLGCSLKSPDDIDDDAAKILQLIGG